MFTVIGTAVISGSTTSWIFLRPQGDASTSAQAPAQSGKVGCDRPLAGDEVIDFVARLLTATLKIAEMSTATAARAGAGRRLLKGNAA
jgi:hypothetical protein